MTSQYDPGQGAIACADAAIDVARIRLTAEGSRFAVVDDLYGADRVLLGWMEQAGGCGVIEVEVRFIDGWVFRGAYRPQHRRACRASLSRFVGQALDALERAAGERAGTATAAAAQRSRPRYALA
jgi:hypothetical protein